MEVLAVVAGLLLLGLLIVDVFGTVFVPRGGAGVLASRLYRIVWAGWSWAANRSGRHRRRVLALAGPVLLPLTVVLWVLVLVGAFALVYLPFTAQLSVPAGGSAASGPVAVLYVSAYAATTLGVGDIYATTPLLRLLITLEAGLGFALFSISITYVLSVYNALLRATALALRISGFIGRQAGEDAVDVVCRSVRARSEEQTLDWLRGTVSELATTNQAQAQYPLIAYFHIPHDDRALPVALADLLRLVTVLRALPDPSAFPALTSGPTVLWASRAVMSFVAEHAQQLRGGEDDTDGGREHLRAYRQARQRLATAGIALRDDEQARVEYLGLVCEWSRPAAALLGHFGYPDPGRSQQGS